MAVKCVILALFMLNSGVFMNHLSYVIFMIFCTFCIFLHPGFRKGLFGFFEAGSWKFLRWLLPWSTAVHGFASMLFMLAHWGRANMHRAVGNMMALAKDLMQPYFNKKKTLHLRVSFTLAAACVVPFLVSDIILIPHSCLSLSSNCLGSRGLRMLLDFLPRLRRIREIK